MFFDIWHWHLTSLFVDCMQCTRASSERVVMTSCWTPSLKPRLNVWSQISHGRRSHTVTSLVSGPHCCILPQWRYTVTSGTWWKATSQWQTDCTVPRSFNCSQPELINSEVMFSPIACDIILVWAQYFIYWLYLHQLCQASRWLLYEINHLCSSVCRNYCHWWRLLPVRFWWNKSMMSWLLGFWRFYHDLISLSLESLTSNRWNVFYVIFICHIMSDLLN